MTSTTQPFPYADLVAFFQRQLGVCRYKELTGISAKDIYAVAKHLAGNLAQVAELYYRSV